MSIRTIRLRPLLGRVLNPDQTWRQISPRSAHEETPSRRGLISEGVPR
jgi:hypothetical protein